MDLSGWWSYSQLCCFKENDFWIKTTLKGRVKSWYKTLPPSLSAMLEIGILLLPSIPAYLYIWPNVQGIHWWVTQSLAYLYVLGGTLWIGLRRWTPAQLGLEQQGLWLGIAAGLVLVAGRTLVILSIDWQEPAPTFSLPRILWELIFYFGFVGLTEELLFRGLIYHLLEEWKGYQWAIWGSALGFALWHVFGQGPLIALAMVFYGLTFALLRWRAKGILGLILAHGLVDFTSAQMLPDFEASGFVRPEVSCDLFLMMGLIILMALPLYLWKLHPVLHRRLTR